ncbi:MAG: ethanolamine utilization protein EutH [Clostridia bacterium]|nr:ethanolamine utilization protein EutH [Clostridia bacterium]
MNILTLIILIFSVLGALDKIFGSRFGIGKEFDKAFMLLGTMALSMIGMIVISPFIADIMIPLSNMFEKVLHIDPSVIPASLFANDMGGASLSVEMAANEKIGMFNALVVSSMMGCTISFTIPFSLGVVRKEQHKELLLGLLCGIATIPIGCIAGGLICGIPIVSLLMIMLPLVVFSGIIVFGLIKFPEMCIKIFKVFGVFITVLITVGLTLGIIRFLSGIEIIKGLATIEEGASICVNAAIVLSGSFPFMYVLTKVLSKPFKIVSKKMGINEYSVSGFIASLASNATTFGMMDKMDRKGVVMNAAFSVSAAFSLGSHLAFTMAFDEAYVVPVIAGKLISGVLALVLGSIIFNKTEKE